MVAAYFRFPLGVYALTTARSTGTPQISDDSIEVLTSRLSLSYHHRRRFFASQLLDRNLGLSDPAPATPKPQTNMPSQEAGSDPAPGSSSGSADRQAPDTQRAEATSQPRTEQELAQVRTRKSIVIPNQAEVAQPKTLALGYFPQPRVRTSPSPKLDALDDSDPRSWGPSRLLQRP